MNRKRKRLCCSLMLALALVQAFPLIAVAGNDPSRFACNQRSKRERFAESCEYNEKGMALEEQGKAREALALYKMAIAAYPTYAVNYCNYGNALADLKRYSEAITQYKKAVSIQPDFAAAYNNMADAMMHQKDYIGAELACKSSIRVDPGYVPAMTNLAEVYISTNKPHEAISVLNKARGLTTTAAMKKIIADDLDIATKLLNTTLTKVSSVADYSGSAKD